MILDISGYWVKPCNQSYMQLASLCQEVISKISEGWKGEMETSKGALESKACK